MSMFICIIFYYNRLDSMMKRNMRVTWTRVGGPHPQTTGWFCRTNLQAVRRTAPIQLIGNRQLTDSPMA